MIIRHSKFNNKIDKSRARVVKKEGDTLPEELRKVFVGFLVVYSFVSEDGGS
jgi:hypothetical protein